jgi:hypothetical protein
MYPIDIAKKLKELFNLIMEDKLNPNKDKNNIANTLRQEREFKEKINDIIKNCGILLDMLIKFPQKEFFDKNNVLLEKLIKSLDNEMIINLLLEDNTFKEKIALLLNGLLSENNIIGVTMLLSSPLKEFIDFKDVIFAKTSLKHLQDIIINEKLNIENTETFLTYIWKIIQQFKIASTDFISLKSPFYQRIKKEINGAIKKKLQQFYNENFN